MEYLDCFKLDTNIDMYDHAVAHPEYFGRAKGWTARLTFLHPDDYIDRCIEGFGFHQTRLGQAPHTKADILGMRSESLVRNYANLMRQGDKFPALVLDYCSCFEQEGLHRAMAAKMVGLDLVPVVIADLA